MRGALLTFAALMAVAAPVLGQTDPAQTFDQLLRLLAARQHGHVSFTEVHSFKMLTRPLQSSGELLYDAPAHLEKRTQQPKPETLILDHGVLTAQRGQRVTVLQLKDYPQIVPLVESTRATLAGDRAALERYFQVQFAGSLEDWSLLLTPLDPAVARSVQQIRITGLRDRIRTVGIDMTDGDRSLLTIGPDIAP
jgi:hypothetical protein